MRRTFVVTLDVLTRQTMEIVAPDECSAEEIALETYNLLDVKILDESVWEVEEVTSYRERASL